MADSQSIITLNIGSQRVSMGVFSRSKSGGLILKAYDTTTILADPAAEMTRLPQIRVAVGELAERLGVSKEKVDYAISGQSVFTRFVKLPSVDNDNLEQLVTFEAQQHVPFPINEVVWDWQLLDTPGAEQEVVLVAIKNDALDDINECVNDANMQTGSVDASPMALCNAFRAAYPDLEEPALLIDIGARTSNLIYVEGKRLFTRSIAIGGSTITTAIAKEYNVSFTEAESQKCSNGLVALDTRHTSQLDELTAALAGCIRTALNRMPAEIARTTNFFRSQHGGSAPKRVFLAGGGSNLPNIGDFFQEKLRLPVEFFNPLKTVAVGSGVDVDKVSAEAHFLGELVGLGLRRVDKAELKIDLVPDVVQSRRDDDRRKPFLIGAAAIILGSFAALYFANASSKSDATQESQAVAKRVKGLKQFSIPLEKSGGEEESLEEIVGEYQDAHKGQVYWLKAVDDLRKNFGDRFVWVVDFDPLVNYDPDTDNVQSLFKEEVLKAEYGKSMKELIKTEPEELSNGRPNPKYVQPMINAVRLKGFWRGAGGSSKVTALVERLGSNSEYFTFDVSKIENSKVVTKTLKLDQIVKENASVPKEGDYAAPFTVIVPLKTPIPLK